MLCLCELFNLYVNGTIVGQVQFALLERGGGKYWSHIIGESIGFGRCAKKVLIHFLVAIFVMVYGHRI